MTVTGLPLNHRFDEAREIEIVDCATFVAMRYDVVPYGDNVDYAVGLVVKWFDAAAIDNQRCCKRVSCGVGVGRNYAAEK